MVKLWFWGMMFCLGFCGCAGTTIPEGSEAAGRRFFESEFQKWIGGQETQVSTMKSKTQNLKRPISYNIRSTVQDKPDPLAFDQTKDLPGNWKSWPAWRFNVAIEWESQAGTPVTKVTTYRLTWNSHEKRWYVDEQFE